MDPKDRYEQERNENRNQREQLILSSAERVFAEKGIEKTTMQNIAKEANLGIATLFRYFPKKEKLVVAVAVRMIEPVLEEFKSVSRLPLTCIDKIDRLLDQFIAPIRFNNELHIKFLEDFESYAAHSPEPLEDIEDFNNQYRKVSRVFSSIIQEGIDDGSLRPDLPVHDTLTTVVNATAIFARKLSLQSILRLESDLEAERQLDILKKIIMSYLRG